MCEQVSILQAQPTSSAEACQHVLQGVIQIRRMLEGTLDPPGDAIDQVGEDVVNLAAQVTNLEGQVSQVGQLVMTLAMQVARLYRAVGQTCNGSSAAGTASPGTPPQAVAPTTPGWELVFSRIPEDAQSRSDGSSTQ
ncbi:unnamed protein product [Prorocentrum cordatum]|uniref:Uncharacterized protein n=1 Tax=Prorocentrum cordatum TaxID=2364126 RepID=A0ABN9V7D3_9DINO|nr:unnamed protein product [Polarella glacialis]